MHVISASLLLSGAENLINCSEASDLNLFPQALLSESLGKHLLYKIQFCDHKTCKYASFSVKIFGFCESSTNISMGTCQQTHPYYL